MADFGLREVYQTKSFGAQMARQMNTAFPQPLIESPGIGNAPRINTVSDGNEIRTPAGEENP